MRLVAPLRAGVLIACSAMAVSSVAEQGPADTSPSPRTPGPKLLSVYGESAWAQDSPVSFVAFSSDGTRVVSAAAQGGGRAGYVSIRRANDGKLLATVRDPERPVAAAALAADGTLALVRGSGGRRGEPAFGSSPVPEARPTRVELFDREGKRLGVLPALGAGFAESGALAFSPDSKRLAAAGDEVSLLDLGAEDVLTTLDGSGDRARSVGFSPDGKRVFTHGASGTVRVLEVATAREIGRVVLEPPEIPAGAVFSASGKRALVPRRGGASVVDLSALEVVSELPGVCAESLAISPEDARAALGGHDGSIRIVDLATGAVTAVRGTTVEDDPVLSLAFSPDGKLLCAGCSDGGIRVFDVATGKETTGAPELAGPVTSLAFSPDALLVSVTSKGAATSWDTARGKPVRTWLLPSAASRRPLAVSPDGKRTVALDAGGELALLDSGDGHEIAKLAKSAAGAAAIFSPDGKLVILGGGGVPFAIADASSGTRLRACRDAPSEHVSPLLALSPDGRWAVVGACLVPLVSRGTSASIDLPTGDEDVRSAVFAPGGEWVAVGTARGRVLRFALSATGAASAWSEPAQPPEPCIRGVVLDTKGKPIAGALASFTSFENRYEAPSRVRGPFTLDVAADSAGRYELRPVDRSVPYRVDLAAPGFVRAVRFVERSGESGNDVPAVTLVRPGGLRVLVRDDSGRPVAGARVALTPELVPVPPDPDELESCSESVSLGSVPLVFGGLTEGIWRVDAGDDSGSGYVRVAVVEGKTLAAEVRMERRPTGGLELTVRSPSGEARKARIGLVFPGGSIREEVTAEDGELALEGLPAGTVEVLALEVPGPDERSDRSSGARGTDPEPMVFHGQVQIAAGKPTKLAIALGPPVQVSGRVLARDLSPASIRVVAKARNDAFASGASLAATGSFSLSLPPVESRVLVFVHEAFPLVERDIAASGQEGIEIALPETATLECEAEAASLSGRPSILISRGDGRDALEYPSGLGVRGLPAGRYVVAAWGRSGTGGFLAGSVAVDCEAGRKTRVLVPLAPAGSCSGRVLDARGAPCSSVGVELRATLGSYRDHAVSDREGRFGFSGLCEGDYLLEVDKDGLLLAAARQGSRRATARPVTLHVGSGETREATVRVEAE